MNRSFHSFFVVSALVLLTLTGSSVWADDTSTQAEAVATVPEGLDLPNAKMPFPGIVVGGQPSPEHLKRAAELGVAWVVDLRGVGELEGRDEKAEVEALGMAYVSIPIAGKDDLGPEPAARLAQALEGATADSDPAKGPRILVHCASGNRVGGLFALKAFHVDGLDAEAALALGEKVGLRASLRPAIEGLLSPPESTP